MDAPYDGGVNPGSGLMPGEECKEAPFTLFTVVGMLCLGLLQVFRTWISGRRLWMAGRMVGSLAGTMAAAVAPFLVVRATRGVEAVGSGASSVGRRPGLGLGSGHILRAPLSS